MIRTYSLSHAAGRPLYEQLYEAVKADILSGSLAGGEKLPSKRALAEHLNVSKITVETAYGQLLAEGYITSRERAGYYVEQILLTPQPPVQPEPPAPEPERPEPPRSASAELFPFSVWARLMRGVILDKYQNLLQPVPNAGLPALRQAIADELYRQRGMEVLPEQILIGAGAEYFYNLILQFLGRDRLYGLEELGHRKIARIYEANGVAIAPIAMDGEGIRVDALEKSGASVVHLSPSHHYPTGIVTPIGRRQALMRWLAEKPDRYAVEDDYDSEFRFTGRPIPTMQSMDTTGRLLYMNTFSRTIAPALRISYMILPRTLLPAWREKLGFYSCTVPSFEQLTLTRFIAEGCFEKHVSRMKKHYREVRARLLAALAASPLAARCTVLGADAGLHFLVKIRTGRSDEELGALLARAGLRLPFLSSFYISGSAQAARACVVVNYAELDPAELERALARLEQLIAAETK